MIDKKVYRTDFNRPQRQGQVFCSVKVKYRLNEAINELVEDGTVDVDELIASAVPKQLDEILEALLPVKSVELVDGVVDCDVLRDKLDVVQHGFNVAESLKKQFNLPDDMPLSEVVAFVSRETNKGKEENENAQSGVDSSESSGVDNVDSSDNQENKGGKE